ncbi:ClpXP protease specificity-enhancing factor [Kushneria phyllosphaerae]|uniref:Stringent starvation protein B n=1 Tax=Kushneria phyllosphaerae TaxID=2100822 RepID=A0A2R8CQA8_9GAMM|nr:ClpXP protease specificity-enhancing factor [Kushneria phyllosphaerae]SPJ35065.1 Stringent starvation protein B [Kushneria phyllosphaerae]
MHSSRPYLIRALYQWLLDNDCTPYVVVDAERTGVVVPEQFVQNGQIVLNIGPGAVRELFMENDMVAFNARFSGQPMTVELPIDAIVAIYARENGVGMVFGQEPVMPDDASDAAESGSDELDERDSHLGAVARTDEESGEGNDDDDDDSRPRKGRPSLKVIK